MGRFFQDVKSCHAVQATMWLSSHLLKIQPNNRSVEVKTVIFLLFHHGLSIWFSYS